MAPGPSPLFTGSPTRTTPSLSLHLLSAVTAASASASAGSNMGTPVGDESPPSQDPPPHSLPSPSPPPRSPPPKPASASSALPSRPVPVREDCWSEEATSTLIEAWSHRYVELKKGNLRRKHWQEVADAVNAVHGHTKKTKRTDIQCKNRIDTIKKKYKVEKAKTVDSRGAYVSPWRFFSRLDSLIGECMVNKFSTSTPSPAATGSGDHLRKKSTAPSPSPALAALNSHVPVGPRSLKPKRPAAMDDSFFRRTFAAAAAAASESEDEEDEDEREEPETSRSSGAGSRRPGWRREGGEASDGCRQLAEAILRFGEIYERVEGIKQEQMIELEKHRMQFAKELEFQRMKLLMDTQLQLAKIKRMKPSNDADADSY